MINPMTLLKMKNIWSKFEANHPKFPLFLKAVSQAGLAEDSIIEINITTADGKNFASNLKIKPEDMELLEEIKNIRG